ncbi:hypothetical protein GGR53DRAFT_465452 [Hypoxylon sp. FL1150]|nr:hypothetical protein GGR53DRAFT_465452 [Hypoxylon sp. FL1150]
MAYTALPGGYQRVNKTQSDRRKGAVLMLEYVDSLGGVLSRTNGLIHRGNILYDLFLHPLASFPGPLLYRASRLPWTTALLRGQVVFDSVDIHSKYGPTVRVAHNELAFLDTKAWRDIRGGALLRFRNDAVFDIICDLTVCESLKCLESDNLHPWITAMVDGGKPLGFLADQQASNSGYTFEYSLEHRRLGPNASLR